MTYIHHHYTWAWCCWLRATAPYFDWRHAKRFRVPTSLSRRWLFALPNFHGRFVAVAFCSRPATRADWPHRDVFTSCGSGRFCGGSGDNQGESCNIFSNCRGGIAKYPGESSKACLLLCKTTYQEAATKYRQISQCRFGRKASNDWSCGKFAQWLVECGWVGWWCRLQVAMSLCWMASCTRLLRSQARSSRGCCKRGCHGFSA